MSDEQWKCYPGDERYEVSDQGRVRSYCQAEPRLLATQVARSGHLRVHLSGGVRLVHHLVMETFVGPRPSGLDTRHLDGDPTNNHLDNLAYGTRSQNALDSVAHGTHAEARRSHCVKGHPFDVYSGGFRRCSICRKTQGRPRLEVAS